MANVISIEILINCNQIHAESLEIYSSDLPILNIHFNSIAWMRKLYENTDHIARNIFKSF